MADQNYQDQLLLEKLNKVLEAHGLDPSELGGFKVEGLRGSISREEGIQLNSGNDFPKEMDERFMEVARTLTVPRRGWSHAFKSHWIQGKDHNDLMGLLDNMLENAPDRGHGK